MKLAEFYAAIGPFLEGKSGHEEAARALYGEASTRTARQAIDAERLAIYGRFCARHRFDALEFTFEETRRALVQLQDESRWAALVADYFRAHPMHHAELNENGRELPAFLLREAGARELPSWLCELADLEWWSFRTRVAPDDPRDAADGTGALRLGATVELRPYAHELPGWLEARSSDALPDVRADAPAPRPCVVLFWRDRDLDTRFAEATPLELAVMHAVHEGLPLTSAAARVGASAHQLDETLADLHGAGILRGTLPLASAS